MQISTRKINLFGELGSDDSKNGCREFQGPILHRKHWRKSEQKLLQSTLWKLWETVKALQEPNSDGSRKMQVKHARRPLQHLNLALPHPLPQSTGSLKDSSLHSWCGYILQFWRKKEELCFSILSCLEVAWRTCSFYLCFISELSQGRKPAKWRVFLKKTER